MISGTTTLIAHVGYPTHSFKSPLIYNRIMSLPSGSSVNYAHRADRRCC